MNGVEHTGALALVGPGRAGTTIAAALADRGWRVVAVAGRTVGRAKHVAPRRIASVRRRSRSTDARRRCGPRDRGDAGRGHRRGRVRRWRRRFDPTRWSSTCRARAGSTRSSPVPARVGALHPLQTFPSLEAGRAAPGRVMVCDRRRPADPGARRAARARAGRDRRCGPGPVPRRRVHRLQPSRRAARPGAPGRAGPARGVPPVGARHRRERRGHGTRGLARRARWPAATWRPCAATWTRSRARDRDAYRDLARLASEVSGRRRSRARRGPPMIVVERVAELREECERARRAGRTVGLVPTMGFFHEGHRSLMRSARAGDRPGRRHALRESHPVRSRTRTSPRTRATPPVTLRSRRRRASTCCSCRRWRRCIRMALR